MKVTTKFKRGGRFKLPKPFKQKFVKVGLPRNQLATYPDGPSVIQIGIVHEFGDPENNIPERSFIRGSTAANKDKYRKLKKRLIKRVLKGDLPLNDALNALGLVAAGDIKKFIVELKEPPNKRRTITRKGSANPLVDTGLLRNSITHVVVDNV